MDYPEYGSRIPDRRSIMSTTIAARRGLRYISLRIALLGALFAAPALAVAPASAEPGIGPITTHLAPVSDDYDSSGYDRWGYDRHGYDRWGYDREGYDRFGRDNRGYDKEGFDRWGYDREGYDRAGFDTWGYDEDGYDEDGYDRWDYTRDGCRIDGNDQKWAIRRICDAWRARVAAAGPGADRTGLL
ncbi:hypothetical protein [Nocardia testacea]|uniref:hypothetical protein n=1 Tax=Nocardia testacea TaxID=248551 RepID=UPI0012F6FD46|nr:hypothetical protein [Nocardia testacea]